MSKGYTGRVLRVDLSTGTSKVETINWEWAGLYYGARGLGVRYMIDEIPAGLSPLDPENRLILLTGPLTGTLVPSTGKLAVITKSPATGTILDCSVGGSMANAIKLAGYDGIIIQGKAKTPVYLQVEGESVDVLDAANLWGKGTHETESRLVEEMGDDTSVISIGPAGENCLPFACLTSDFYRQAGRGGAGAVMGSKNLKAVAVKGYRGVKVDNMEEFLSQIKTYVDSLLPNTKWASEDGTPCLVQMCQNAGILPTHNFSRGQFEGYSNISLEPIKAALKKKKACTGCPIGCGNYIKVGQVPIEGPEYETLALCGSNCDISNLEAVAEFNRLCDDLGMDSITAGNIVGLAMDMTERGIKDFGVRFGEVESYLKMPLLMALKQGVGAELALGARELCRRYGVELAMEVKGLELPGYEPRGSWGMGLAYATSDRGGCHMRGFTVGREALGDLDPFTGKGKAEVTIEKQDYNAIKWSLTICDFWPVTHDDMAWLLTMVLGKQITVDEVKQAGERIYNLSRLFNVREGFRRDQLPNRVFEEPLGGTGPASGKVIPRNVFEEMLSEYYSLRGWNREGIPEREKLNKLQLDPGVIESVLG